MLLALNRLFPSDNIFTKGLQCFLDRWIFAHACNAMLHLAVLAVRLHQLVTLAVFEIALSYEAHCFTTFAATSASFSPPRPRRSEQEKTARHEPSGYRS
jgi:hypothetical protein